MNARTEDMIDRYLEAVAAQLPVEERDDIIAELRDLILSRVEAREAEKARPLTDDEREAILKEIGHPLVVAARYRKGPDSLIGPELFPYWLYGAKAGLLILGAVFALGLLIRLIGGSANFGQDIAQAFHGFFGAALTLIGALTLAGAVMEHYAIRPKWLTDWRVKDLGAFGLSDPSTWGMAAKSAGERMQARSDGRRSTVPFGVHLGGGGNDVGNAAFTFIAMGMFALWWLGIVHFPGTAGVISIDGENATLSPATIWATLFVPILVYALARMGVALFTIIRPPAVRMRAGLNILMAAFGLWLIWMIFQASDWFTLSVGADSARIAGDMTMLDLDRLRTIGDGPRDLAGIASTLSLGMTWWLAIMGLSLVWKVAKNVGRLFQSSPE
ncbi:hypothetical protein HZ989_14235 [Brevundimonas sp. AJA228-03]|uniref:hypothetical protein n=1 Tax=Brevundimonas sp. AJA228-03 TaxID=2752515 RepID=UPI001ADEDF83|nr:hypothetical protein [Brevundimonas sp. AJA228-03]QTN19356.1 hypothetical protein HZ989_14235 [Brevundimonas sp. AJA228-03]